MTDTAIAPIFHRTDRQGVDLPEIAFVPIEEIMEHPDNWRIHPPEQLDAIRASFAQFGPHRDASDFNVRSGRLIDGHARITVLREQGIDLLYCQLHDFSDEEEKAWLLAKHGTERGTVDDEGKLRLLLAEYVEEDRFPPGWDMDDWDRLVEAGKAEIEKLPFEQPDQPEAVPCRFEVGDVWRIGDHIVACIDSEDEESVKRLLALAGIERVSQVFTDPPYRMETSGGSLKTEAGDDLYNRDKLDAVEAQGLSSCDPESEFLPTLKHWFGWAGDKPNRTNGETLNVFVYCNDALQLPYMRWTDSKRGTWATLMWTKDWRGDPLGGRHETNCEYLLWLKYNALWNERSVAPTADRSKILRYQVTEQQKESDHPTPKSVELAVNEMMLTTKEGDWIADPYCGTGAHAIAAHFLGRRSISCDLNPSYADFTLGWLEMITGEKAKRIQPGLRIE